MDETTSPASHHHINQTLHLDLEKELYPFEKMTEKLLQKEVLERIGDREKLLSWLFQVAEKCKISDEAFFLAVQMGEKAMEKM